MLTLWSIVSYSQAAKSGWNSSRHYVETLTPHDQLRRIPLTHIPQDDNITPVYNYREAKTPARFNEPLDCGFWIDEIPSWLVLEKQIMSVSEGKKVSFSI